MNDKPFIPTKTEEERSKDKFKTFAIKMNLEEYKELQEWKQLIQQSKDSTAIKQLARIGSKVILEDKMKSILDVVLNNYRKNKRLGIVDFD